MPANYGHQELTKLLLNKRAKFTTFEQYYGRALQAASAAGYDAVVSLLLDKGAHVDTSGAQYGSALQSAVKGGHEKVTQTLLSRGAGAQFEHEQWINLLHAAAAGGHTRIVRLLIDRGALPKVTGKTETHAEDDRSTISDPSVSSSLALQAVSSATSAYDAAPDDVFTILVERVFWNSGDKRHLWEDSRH